MKQAGLTPQAILKPGLLFGTLNLADLLLTVFLLSIGAPELNPVFASMGNIYLFASTKVILVGAVMLGLFYFNQSHLFKWLNAGMGLIVAWNILAVMTWVG